MDSHVGLRVIRGHPWTLDKKESGSQQVGTIIAYSKQNRKTSVKIQWDNGIISDITYPGQNHVLVLDSTPMGVFHKQQCSGHKRAIRGFLWKCMETKEELCNECYHVNYGDLKQEYRRFDHPNDQEGRVVGIRKNASRLKIKGIFKRAQVILQKDTQFRGTGKVVSIVRDHALHPRVVVEWRPGDEGMTYNLGKDGKVDVMYVKAADGGSVYAEHLPRPWELEETPLEYECVDVTNLPPQPMPQVEYKKPIPRAERQQQGRKPALPEPLPNEPKYDLAVETEKNTGDEATVIQEYRATNKEELDLKVNDVIDDVIYAGDGFLWGFLRGRKGKFPEECVQFIYSEIDTGETHGDKLSLHSDNSVTSESCYVVPVDEPHQPTDDPDAEKSHDQPTLYPDLYKEVTKPKLPSTTVAFCHRPKGAPPPPPTKVKRPAPGPPTPPPGRSRSLAPDPATPPPSRTIATTPGPPPPPKSSPPSSHRRERVHKPHVPSPSSSDDEQMNQDEEDLDTYEVCEDLVQEMPKKATFTPQQAQENLLKKQFSAELALAVTKPKLAVKPTLKKNQTSDTTPVEKANTSDPALERIKFKLKAIVKAEPEAQSRSPPEVASSTSDGLQKKQNKDNLTSGISSTIESSRVTTTEPVPVKKGKHGKVSVLGKYDYQSDEHGDLSFKKDDVIEKVTITGENWWFGCCHGAKGYFPRNFVKVITEATEPMQPKEEEKLVLEGNPYDLASRADTTAHNLTKPGDTAEETGVVIKRNAAHNRGGLARTLTQYENSTPVILRNKHKNTTRPNTMAEETTDKPAKMKVRIKSNFTAQVEGDLTCAKGDVITDVTRTEDGWWIGTLKGETGVFPSTYAEILPDERKATKLKSDFAETYMKGERVEVSVDQTTFDQLQIGHMRWTGSIQKVQGQGSVLGLKKNGDLMIQFGQVVGIFHPGILSHATIDV